MAGEGRQLFCRLITPERVVYDGEADLVVAKIADGEIGVMVDHYPVISTVDFWDVRITRGDERHVYATSDGFFKVADNLVQILVEEAVPASEINVEEAEHRIEQAERELSELPEEDDESRRAREEISRRVRLGENLVRVARKYRGG
ncbi:ATP synthase epsilon chain, sodium ion specific [Rubrobacter xylanophilus DSM 9941]|uniref:ATP synthase F1 subunit epsilon n=1 Tax=Rubrobacter xylanophilus TaxID=49319 RepID=UPI001C63C99F|nr:ATP synthase F1 subunit epsilon [Rubrobacter xylanophilus]QYJ14907.1 ATP synthase epsilon chain, sodium ion specific [Rubrobacter xylanophilus DSM 9941]